MCVNHSSWLGAKRDNLSIFFDLKKVRCVITVESPHRGDSNEYTQNTIFNTKKEKNHPELSQICSYGIFFKGLKNEFEIAVVNLPSESQPLKVYCSWSGFLLMYMFSFNSELSCQFEIFDYFEEDSTALSNVLTVILMWGLPNLCIFHMVLTPSLGDGLI